LSYGLPCSILSLDSPVRSFGANGQEQQKKELILSPSEQPTLDNILVRKYGGSSLADVQRIRAVALDIAETHRQGHRLVVVVSAMGTTTNELEELARQASNHPSRRELDMLLSVGERITMSLLSMVLEDVGCPAISFTGSQCGIITDTSHTDARIIKVTAERVREALARNQVVVVAGFQGVSEDREITTLGRGGSDTTAVALAAALGAVRCEILKDVDGILSADPKAVPEAWLHRDLTYEEMRDIAETGCGVVHIRAVEFAQKHQVPLQVRSSFHSRQGTIIGPATSLNATHIASDRDNRYRPLSMDIKECVTRLGLSAVGAEQCIRWREKILLLVDPCGVIAEWLDHSSSTLRWEILAPTPILRPFLDELERTQAEPDLVITRDDDLTCFSFAGGRPDSWLEVQRHVGEILNKAGCATWRLRADGSALRVLVGDDLPAELPAQLHRALLPA
jgi:uridylate kinase